MRFLPWLALAPAIFLPGALAAEPVTILRTDTIELVTPAELEGAQAQDRAARDILESGVNDLNQQQAVTGQAMNDLARRLDDMALELSGMKDLLAEHAHEGTDPDPTPDPPPPTGLFKDLPYNTWAQYGPAINSIWPQIDPPLDSLTRGVEGLNATVTQWCGAGFDKARLKFRKSCGGHRATGYNRVYEYDIPAQTMAWASPDSRLTGPEMPVNSCPYPAEHQTLGERAGPAAGHWNDGIVTMQDGSTLFFPEVLYDCKGPGNRQPYSWVFKLSPDGEWSSSQGGYVRPSGGVASEPLPDGKILLIGRYYSGIFDPEAMRLVPFKARGKRFEGQGEYAELGGNNNLTEAGTTSDGSLRFLFSEYHQRIFEILVTKDDDGLWNVGSPRLIPGVKAAWYTAGMEWLPDHNALMYWAGGQDARYILFDGEKPEVRVGAYPEIRNPDGRKFHIHEGGLQWDPVNKVVYAFGVGARDGLFVFRPSQDLRAATEPALAPRQNLQDRVDSANPGDTLTLSGRWTGARIKKPLTIVCEPGATIDGAFTNGQAPLLIETNRFTIDGCTMKTTNRSEGTGALFIAVAGDFTVLNTYIEGFGNGIITTSRGWIGDVNLTVRGSIFVNNGIATGSPGHQIYLGNGHGTTDRADKPRRWTDQDTADNDGLVRWSTAHMHRGTLLIEDSQFYGQTKGGHGIKTGAQTTIIKRSVIKSGDAGLSYRPIDAYSGGKLVLEDVAIFMRYNPAEENSELIAFASEIWSKNWRGHWPDTHEVSITRLTATCEGPGGYVEFSVVKSWYDITPIFNGATEANPAGDSVLTDCGRLYRRN